MERDRHKKKHPFFIHFFTMVIFVSIIFIYAVNKDMANTRTRLLTNVDYIITQCNRFNRIEMAAETKSLMRIIESNKQVVYQLMENDGDDSIEALQRYADSSYVSGIVIMDREGNFVSQYHAENEEHAALFEALSSPAVKDLFLYPEKRYSIRVNMPDGSEVDVAAMKMTDEEKIVAVYYHTPLEYISAFNLSIGSLLTSYDKKKDGTLVITRSGSIVASNDDTLVGKNVEDIPILNKITMAKESGKLVHTKQSPTSLSRSFGLMERGRDFYVYSYIPERSVFGGTPAVILYTFIGYAVLLSIIYAVKKRNEQQIQVKYTEELKNKNEQLGEAIVQANRANEAKSSFLSRMSHDIRTPLNGIIGLLEISETHPDDKEMLKENRQKMKIAANHLLSLINDVLQMSKLESGEIIIAHEPLNLNRLAKDVIAIVEQKAAEEGVTLKYDLASDKIEDNWVYGSALHLRQIFLNIYTNSIKYNKVGGTITTRVELVENDNNIVTYRWVISDTGIGMSKEFLEKIFDPFTQERSDARSVYQGTGLGMTIVKGLIEQMHGTITVTSEENVGSEFVITLPFEIAEKPEEMTETEIEAADTLDGMHILVAEDNDLNAEIAQILLEDSGAKVTMAGDGKEAVEIFEKNAPGTFDVILMDVMMPVMDGLTASRTLRELERPDAKTIPIIAMTANAFKEDAEKCLAAGMDAHMAKPLDISKLKQVIYQYTSIRKKQSKDHKITE